MKTTTSILIILLLSLLFFRCKKESSHYQAVTLKGAVYDSYSGQPIPNVDVSILKYVSTGYMSPGKYDLVGSFTTQNDGSYSYNFSPDARTDYDLQFSKDQMLDSTTSNGLGFRTVYQTYSRQTFNSFDQSSYTLNSTLTPSAVVKFNIKFANPSLYCHLYASPIPRGSYIILTDSLNNYYASTDMNRVLNYKIIVFRNADTIVQKTDSILAKGYQLNTVKLTF